MTDLDRIERIVTRARRRQLGTNPRPSDDVDHAVIWRWLHGQPAPTPTPAELATVVAEFAKRGYSDPVIARIVDRDPRTVLRIRRRHGIPAGWARATQ